MNVYAVSPKSNNKTASLVFSRELNIGERYYFDGQSQAAHWKPLILKWNLEKSYPLEQLKKNDFSMIVGAGVNIVLNEKAKSVFEALFEGDVEYLPVNVKDDNNNYYLMNIINIVENALNLEQCEFRVRRNGEIGVIRKTVFDTKNIPDNRLFVYPQMPSVASFKGELLKDICKEHGLTGLEFEEVLTASS